VSLLDAECMCAPGYTGDSCSQEINECDPNPCMNNASCVDLVNDFMCMCPQCFYGDRCQFEMDFELCFNCSCLNNATCQPVSIQSGVGSEFNAFSCLCIQGFTDYMCECLQGYSGRSCETELDPCDSFQCANGGTCVSVSLLEAECVCPLGYTEENCSQEINECDPNPCMNNAGCVDLMNSFMCMCPQCFYGDRCQFEMDFELCFNCSCLNNATCRPASIQSGVGSGDGRILLPAEDTREVECVWQKR